MLARYLACLGEGASGGFNLQIPGTDILHHYSQGQGTACRPARQGDLREDVQRCRILPPRHSRHARRQTKGQRFPGKKVPEGPRGEGSDQAGGYTQQAQDLQYVQMSCDELITTTNMHD